MRWKAWTLRQAIAMAGFRSAAALLRSAGLSPEVYASDMSRMTTTGWSGYGALRRGVARALWPRVSAAAAESRLDQVLTNTARLAARKG